MTFEKGLKRLEALVARLEEGDLGLDAALKAFEEGVGLSRELLAKLDVAEKKVEMLVRDGDSLGAVPFEEDGDTDIPGNSAE